MPEIHIASFFRAALGVSDTSTIKATDDRAKAVGHWTWRSTNTESMKAFVSALKKEYGLNFADAVTLTFRSEIAASRPLTARMVNDVKALADSFKAQANMAARESFLSDANGEFSVVVSGALKDTADRLDEDTLKVLKEGVKADIRARFPNDRAEPVTVEQVKSAVRMNQLLFFAKHYFSDYSPMAVIPGRQQDKAAVLTHVVGSMDCAMAIQKLDDILRAAGNGPITKQAIWRGCFNEEIPQISGRFRDAFERRAEAFLNGIVPGKAEQLRQLCNVMKLDVAVGLLTGPPRTLTGKDLISPECSLEPGKSDTEPEQLMARDICRRATELPTIQGDMVSMPPRIIIGDKTYTVSHDTDFKFSNEEDRTSYSQGRPSTFTGELVGRIRTLCGGAEADEAQVAMLTRLCSQAPMRNIMGTGGVGCFNGIYPSAITEHAPTDITMTAGDKGHVTIRIATPSDPNLTAVNGRLSMIYDIAPDGRWSVTDFALMPPRGKVDGLGPMAQDIRHGLAAAVEAGVHKGSLQENISEALSLGRITPEEAAKLKDFLGALSSPPLRSEAMDIREAARVSLEENPRNYQVIQDRLTADRNDGRITADEYRIISEDLQRYAPLASIVHLIPTMSENGLTAEDIEVEVKAQVAARNVTEEDGRTVLDMLDRTPRGISDRLDRIDPGTRDGRALQSGLAAARSAFPDLLPQMPFNALKAHSEMGRDIFYAVQSKIEKAHAPVTAEDLGRIVLDVATQKAAVAHLNGVIDNLITAEKYIEPDKAHPLYNEACTSHLRNGAVRMLTKMHPELLKASNLKALDATLGGLKDKPARLTGYTVSQNRIMLESFNKGIETAATAFGMSLDAFHKAANYKDITSRYAYASQGAASAYVEGVPMSNKEITKLFKKATDRFVNAKVGMLRSLGELNLSLSAKEYHRALILSDDTLKNADTFTKTGAVALRLPAAGSLTIALNDPKTSTERLISLFASVGVACREATADIYANDDAGMGADGFSMIMHYTTSAYLDRNPALYAAMKAHPEKLDAVIGFLAPRVNEIAETSKEEFMKFKHMLEFVMHAGLLVKK